MKELHIEFHEQDCPVTGDLRIMGRQALILEAALDKEARMIVGKKAEVKLHLAESFKRHIYATPLKAAFDMHRETMRVLPPSVYPKGIDNAYKVLIQTMQPELVEVDTQPG